MTHLFEKSGADVTPQLVHQHKEAALAQVGLAAVRYVDSQAPRDFAQLRFAVCRFEMYDNIAREAGGLAVAG